MTVIAGKDLRIGDEITVFYRLRIWGWCKIIDIEYIERRHKYILSLKELKSPHSHHYVNAKRVCEWKRGSASILIGGQ